MDGRSKFDKLLWERIGEPLYYCAECKLAVDVKAVDGGEPIIKRQCDHTGEIIAPRKVVCMGEGKIQDSTIWGMIVSGVPLSTIREIIKMRVKAALTGRT